MHDVFSKLVRKACIAKLKKESIYKREKVFVSEDFFQAPPSAEERIDGGQEAFFHVPRKAPIQE